MLDWSAVRTWSICTGVDVCVERITSPSPSFGAEGVPGWMSTKKLPSRKMRGRMSDRGVLVDRQAHVVDAHRDPDTLVALAQRLDLR